MFQFQSGSSHLGQIFLIYQIRQGLEIDGWTQQTCMLLTIMNKLFQNCVNNSIWVGTLQAQWEETIRQLYITVLRVLFLQQVVFQKKMVHEPYLMLWNNEVENMKILQRGEQWNMVLEQAGDSAMYSISYPQKIVCRVTG